MNQQNQQSDDLTRRIEDAERELAALKALVSAATPTIIRARLHVYLDDVAAGLGRHRQAVEDATRRVIPF